jgi:hypothetical protein
MGGRQQLDGKHELFLAALAGCQDAGSRVTMDKVSYCKTLPHKFEKEYHLAIPSDDEGRSRISSG